jgi:AraC-like DNA-binding protein
MDIVFHEARDAERPQVESLKIESSTLALEGVAVLFVAQGSLSVRLDDEERFVLGAGDLLCVGAGSRCRVGDRRSLAEVILFRSDRRWIDSALAVAGEPEPTPTGVVAIDRAGTEVARRAERLMRSLLLPPRLRDAGAGLREAAALLQLAALALETRPEAAIPHNVRRAASARRSRVLEALTAMMDGPLYAVSIRTLAERVSLSERQVSRLVREESGASFREFVSRVRIERAKKLLSESDLAVIEIAAEAGWSSLSHFNTVFRSRVGLTPTQFRAKLRI